MRLRSPLVLAVQLWHGNVRLVDHHQEVLGEVVEQRVGRLPRTPAVDGRRVVLDAVAVAELGHHLQVVAGAHLQALGLEQLALGLEEREPLGQLLLDADDGGLHPLGAGGVVGGREHHQILEGLQALAGERVEHGDAFNLVAEELDPHRSLVIGGMDLDGVAPHPELAPRQVHVVALVLQVDQAAKDRALVVLGAGVDH